MNVLITGVAGFVGAKLASLLLAKGAKVYGVDNFFNSNLDSVPAGVEFFEGDISAGGWIDYFAACDIDIVFHLAAQSSGEVSFRDPIYDCSTNVLGALRVCQFAERTGAKKIIFSSSMSVYGSSQGKVAVGANIEPLSYYAVGKRASEDYFRLFSASQNIEITSLRFFNIYGPGQNLSNPDQGMVSIFLAQLLEGRQFQVKGSLDRFRDFVYIDDAVAVLDTIARQRSSSHFEIVNVGTGTALAVREVLEVLQQTFEKKAEITVSQGTPGDQSGIASAEDDIYRLLGRKPVSFTEGVLRWRQDLHK